LLRRLAGQLAGDVHLLAAGQCQIHLQRWQIQQSPHARQLAKGAFAPGLCGNLITK